MVTEISPVFGMSLVALIETATIIGAVVGISSGGIVAGVVYYVNKRLLNQQKKVESARMIRELSGPWRNNAEFKEFLQNLNNPQVTAYDSRMVDKVLNHFDLIATLSEDGILTEFHVRSLFSANLATMRSDTFILNHITEAQKIKPRTFKYIQTLFEQSKKWDTSPPDRRRRWHLH